MIVKNKYIVFMVTFTVLSIFLIPNVAVVLENEEAPIAEALDLSAYKIVAEIQRDLDLTPREEPQMDSSDEKRLFIEYRREMAEQKREEEQLQKEWIDRINNYLSGSPMAGQGEHFLRASQKYNIDPRLSVAIATVESGKGRHQANSYNAWGVRSGSGWRGYSSWEDAIYSHASLIKRVYGASSTPESMAKKYCPPTWQSWAGKVRGEMNKI